MGCVPPAPQFLDGLRYLTARDDTLLIFDEVMTGFRVAFGGAQELYGTRPDLTTLGKIIGGGLPVGAYGGPAEFMDQVAPLGPVYQAGTLSGNPLAMAAGLAAVRYLRDHRELYGQLERRAAMLVEMVRDAAHEAGVAVTANRVGSMFTWFFTSEPVKDWPSAAKSDTASFGKFHRGMLEERIYLPPSQFEAAFLSVAHTEEDVRVTVEAARKVFAAVTR
jgi:glutamate-1-semialdehyde 2,1-aminomutase